MQAGKILKGEQEKIIRDIFKSQLNKEIHKCW